MGYTSAPLSPIQVSTSALDGDASAPTGTIAQNFSRNSVNCTGTQAVLTSGTLALSAIGLRLGAVITTFNHRSGTTAANLPLNNWFALYDSSLNLINQSTDQLTAAYGASSTKSLALDSVPVTAGARAASTTVTLTFPTLSLPLTTYFAVGDSITVSNANIAAYNGTFAITAIPSATTLTYTSGGSATDNLAAPFPTVQMAAGKRTFTVATAGLYYVGMMMVATAVITSGGIANSGLNPILPVLNGTSTAALTGTAPSPAGAIASTSTYPYVWLT